MNFKLLARTTATTATIAIGALAIFVVGGAGVVRAMEPLPAAIAGSPPTTPDDGAAPADGVGDAPADGVLDPATTVDNLAANSAATDGMAQRFGWVFSGAVSTSTRFYTNADPFPDAVVDLIPGLSDDQFYPFISGNAKVSYLNPNGRDRLTLDVYGRYSFKGSTANGDRGMVDLAEANYYHDGGSYNYLIGSHKVFWGVAESRHLVDIINQTDLNGDPEREAKLGQPMVNVNFTGDAGTLSLFGLFVFREQNFSQAADRLPIGYLVKESAAQFEDGDWRNAAFAARYSKTVQLGQASLDFATSFFTGTARNPRLVPALDLHVDPPIFLVPYYDHIDQIGQELLLVYDRLQLKFEGIYRRQNGDDIFAAVGGFEYTFDSPVFKNLNIGIIGEYAYDNRDFQDDPLALQGNSVFAGIRLTSTGKGGTNLIAGMNYDFDDDSQFYMFDLSRRISDNLEINAEGRFYNNYPKDNPFFFYNKQDYLQAGLTRYF